MKTFEHSNTSILNRELEEKGYVTRAQLEPWQRRAEQALAVEPVQWHILDDEHRGVLLFAPEDFAKLNPEDFPIKRNERAKQADLERLKIRIVFEKAVSGFTGRSQMKFGEVELFDFADIRKRDNKILGVGGRRISSNNKTVEYYYLPPRCRKWREITRHQAEKLGYVFA